MAGGPDPDPNSTVQASLKALQVENALLAAFQPAMETELQHARSENAMLKRDLAKASAGKDRNVRGTPSARPTMPQMPQSEPTVSLKLEPAEPRAGVDDTCAGHLAETARHASHVPQPAYRRLFARQQHDLLLSGSG